VAIKGISLVWAKAYGISKDPQVDDNTLDFHTVANNLRKVASQSYRATAKIAKWTLDDPLLAKSVSMAKDANEGKARQKRDFHMVANDLRKVAIQSYRATAKIAKGTLDDPFLAKSASMAGAKRARKMPAKTRLESKEVIYAQARPAEQ
jgi:hypothetical protein